MEWNEVGAVYWVYNFPPIPSWIIFKQVDYIKCIYHKWFISLCKVDYIPCLSQSVIIFEAVEISKKIMK